MNEFVQIITKDDLSNNTISMSLSENRLLNIFNPCYDDIEGIDYIVRNLNAIYYLADGNKEMYDKAIQLYRQELNVFADEATDEATSHLLGAGQDFSAIYRDMQHYLNENIAFREHVLTNASQSTKPQLELIWNNKIMWYNRAILLAKHANWLVSKFEDGKYHNISGLCQLIYQID